MTDFITRLAAIRDYLRAEGPLNGTEVCRVVETTLADLMGEVEAEPEPSHDDEGPMIIVQYVEGAWQIDFTGHQGGFDSRDSVVTESLETALMTVASAAEHCLAILAPEEAEEDSYTIVKSSELRKYMEGFVHSSMDTVQEYLNDIVTTDGVLEAPYQSPERPPVDSPPILITTPVIPDDARPKPMGTREGKRAKLRRRPRLRRR